MGSYILYMAGKAHLDNFFILIIYIMSKLSQIDASNLTVGPTSMYDSSVALKNHIRKRINHDGKRAQSFGHNGKNNQTSGIKGTGTDHVYFMNLFPSTTLCKASP